MDTTTDMDAIAMERLASGEDFALNDLMRRWHDRVAAFLLRMTCNQSVACDLTQETFVRLYQNCTRYKPTASFPSYLFRIAANLARNHHRWHVRHPAESIHKLEDIGMEPASEASTPDEALAQVDTARAVQRAVRNLPEELRETLVLFTYHELGYHEIAAISGCSPKAVETRLYRARQILKGSLQDLATTITHS